MTRHARLSISPKRDVVMSGGFISRDLRLDGRGAALVPRVDSEGAERHGAREPGRARDVGGETDKARTDVIHIHGLCPPRAGSGKGRHHRCHALPRR